MNKKILATTGITVIAVIVVITLIMVTNNDNTSTSSNQNQSSNQAIESGYGSDLSNTGDDRLDEISLGFGSSASNSMAKLKFPERWNANQTNRSATYSDADGNVYTIKVDIKRGASNEPITAKQYVEGIKEQTDNGTTYDLTVNDKQYDVVTYNRNGGSARVFAIVPPTSSSYVYAVSLISPVELDQTDDEVVEEFHQTVGSLRFE